MSSISHAAGFIVDSGEMSALLHVHDWAATPIGAMATWPQSLRSSLSVCLNTSLVSAVHWGPELTIIYNDAYIPALQDKHPWALGKPFSVVWAEIWDVLGPQIQLVLDTGRGFSTEQQMLKMKRLGRVEDTYWIYSFAPIRDESNAVAGIFVTALETTATVIAEKNIAFRISLSDRLRGLSDPGHVIATATEALGLELSADRVGYAEMDESGEFATVESEWRVTGMPSLIGRHRLSDFGPYLAASFRAGKQFCLTTRRRKSPPPTN